jgi:DNA-binding transcriptional ArsR family regulator
MTFEEVDEVFGALADRRQRLVLYYLAEHGSATLDELATLVTGWTTVRDEGRVAARDHEWVRVSLHHVNLPKLDGAGLVSYDARTGAVQLEDLTGLEAESLSVAFDHDRVPDAMADPALVDERP